MNGETRSELTRSRRSLALDYERAIAANAELRRELQKCRHAKSQALSRLKRERAERSMVAADRDQWSRDCIMQAKELSDAAQREWELIKQLETPIWSWFKGLWTRRAQA